MDPHGPIAQRFPLIARFRPACLPLARRVHALVELAETAADEADQGLASAAYNQAALIASDVGVPATAREMCHQHAAAYLHACPLPGMAAIRALEPVVNLARLQIRAGNAQDGRRRLLALYEAASAGTSAQFEGVHVPANLTASDADRHEVRAWLWRVVLADGTRTLTTAGRWDDALAHIKEHHGIGQRMLDGRQVAVLAALTSGHADDAAALVADTAPGEVWEEAVTACLDAMGRCALVRPVEDLLTDLANSYVQRESEHGMTVFDIRLGLTILDLLKKPRGAVARRVVEDLFRRTSTATDGYAARECLAHPRFTALATARQTDEARNLVRACALGSGGLPDNLAAALTEALRTSDHVIRGDFRADRGFRVR